MSKQTKNLVVQLRLTDEQYGSIRRAATGLALDPATWMRMTLVREAALEAPQCWCGSEAGVHRVPYVQDLVGDRCLRATDWKLFAVELPGEERRALLNRVAELVVPRRAGILRSESSAAPANDSLRSSSNPNRRK